MFIQWFLENIYITVILERNTNKWASLEIQTESETKLKMKVLSYYCISTRSVDQFTPVSVKLEMKVLSYYCISTRSVNQFTPVSVKLVILLFTVTFVYKSNQSGKNYVNILV